jgi:mRNA interferase MazF
LDLTDAPGNASVGKSEAGLAKASVVNVSQIITLDREVRTQRVSGLPADTMRQIDEGLCLALGL